MNFEEQFIDAIDQELSLLGELEKETLYYYLENNFRLTKKNIPYRIKDFEEVIENLFGIGAKILEIRIMKNLHNRIRPPSRIFPEKDSLEFSDYVESARQNKYFLDNFKELQFNNKELRFYLKL